MTFALLLFRRPAAKKSSVNRKYRCAIRRAASAQWSGKPIAKGCLYARIAWLHKRNTQQDVDNIVKPILDALKGIVYDNDVRIVQCLSTKADMGNCTFSTRVPVSPAFDRLVDAAGGYHEHILYVEVGEVSSPRIVFGMIDGGGM